MVRVETVRIQSLDRADHRREAINMQRNRYAERG